MTTATRQWWIDNDGDHLCICEGEVNDCGEREEVAVLHCNRPSLRASQPANASLIAAAPELLDACKHALHALNTAPRFRCGVLNSYDIASMLNHAIAKAEGRTE